MPFLKFGFKLSNPEDVSTGVHRNVVRKKKPKFQKKFY